MNSAVPRNKAFTLVELLIVIAIIGVLVGLLLPAIQMAREASRRGACQNNLHQVGIALESYEGRLRRYPIGARRNEIRPSGQSSYGVSWWADILGDLEESALAARLDTTGPNAGWVKLHPENGQLLNGVVIGTMNCPSSPIPPLYVNGRLQIQVPSYVGISGASSGDDFVEKTAQDCCTTPGGELSAGGVLVPNTSILRCKITDGTSHTLIVGETSDYALGSSGDMHQIGGGFPDGWLMGTIGVGTPPNYYPRTADVENVTTIRYPIGTRDYTLPGISELHGTNNPLLSAHPGGAVSLFADGSVQFLTEQTDVLTLKRFASRDDSGNDNR
jgi:prepilin-type N-terminal cleavage/methylation domain-containing protein/prepilin-type processing-associated H-X9-DG protein